MYTISNEIRNKIYNGGLDYTPLISIGGVEVDWSNIEYISIDDPIIDKASQTMYLGTFVSKKLEMKFRVPPAIDLTAPITYIIKITEESSGDETIVPIGVFNIETSPKDYYEKSTIVALDNAVKFKTAVNIHDFFDEETDDITALGLLQALCEHYGVTLATYPNVNTNIKTASYDNSISGKQYISYIAEIMGGYAKIDRLGRLKIVPAKSNSVATIDATKANSLKIGEEYKITEVKYDNGDYVHSAPSTPETGNTLYIRPDNVFITGTEEQRDEIISNIYNAVGNLSIRSITVENYADFTLDAEDIVTYTVDNDSYLTYYNNSYSFKGSIMGKVEISIPTKNQQATTNVIATNLATQVRAIRTTVDQQSATFTREIIDTQNQVSELSDSIEKFLVDLDTNNIVVLVDTENKPLETKTYEINYIAKFMGSTVIPTVSTVDTHTGITVSYATNKIRFAVENSTSISALSNSYNFTFAYTDNSTNYTATRTVTLSLAQQGEKGEKGDDGTIQSATAPTDTTKLWYDTVNNQLKRYDGTEWVIVNDYSSDIQSLTDNLNDLGKDQQKQLNDLNNVISTYQQTVSAQFQQTSNDFNLLFNTLQTQVTQNTDNINTNQTTLQKYIRFVDGKIILGEKSDETSTSPYSLKIENDRIGIYYNDTLIASWVQDKLDIVQQTIGATNHKFMWVTLTNGSLSLRKVSE